MIRDNQKIFNRLLVLLDAIVVAVSYFLAWFIYLGGSVVEMAPGTGKLADEIYFSALFQSFQDFCYYIISLTDTRQSVRQDKNMKFLIS